MKKTIRMPKTKMLTKASRILLVLAFIFVPYWIGSIYPPIEDNVLINWTCGVLAIASVIGSWMLIQGTFRFIMTGEFINTSEE